MDLIIGLNGLLKLNIYCKMDKRKELKAGDIIGLSSENFLGKSIRKFMNLYKKVFKLEKSEQSINHIAVCIEIDGRRYITEADKTVIIRPFESTKYWKNTDNWIIIRDKRKFTEKQLGKMTDKAITMAGTIYQVSNFAAWSVYIFSFGLINMLKKENEKTVYCSEYGAILDNEAHVGTWKEPNRVNPYDFLINENKIILYGD